MSAHFRARLLSAASRLKTGSAARLRDRSGTYYFRDHLLGAGRGKLAFVYPGVMSFYPDMMRDLAVLHPQTNPLAAAMMLALAVLLGFYFYHYFFLENTVQRWYTLADRLRAATRPGPGHKPTEP